MLRLKFKLKETTDTPCIQNKHLYRLLSEEKLCTFNALTKRGLLLSRVRLAARVGRLEPWLLLWADSSYAGVPSSSFCPLVNIIISILL